LTVGVILAGKLGTTDEDGNMQKMPLTQRDLTVILTIKQKVINPACSDSQGKSIKD
jgi:hypothetical protein